MIVARVAKPITNKENDDITLDYIKENIEKGDISNDYLDIFKVKQNILKTSVWEIMPEREGVVFQKIKASSSLFRDVRASIYEGFISGGFGTKFSDALSSAHTDYEARRW